MLMFVGDPRTFSVARRAVGRESRSGALPFTLPKRLGAADAAGAFRDGAWCMSSSSCTARHDTHSDHQHHTDSHTVPSQL
jgi:putative hemolysin